MTARRARRTAGSPPMSSPPKTTRQCTAWTRRTRTTRRVAACRGAARARSAQTVSSSSIGSAPSAARWSRARPGSPACRRRRKRPSRRRPRPAALSTVLSRWRRARGSPGCSWPWWPCCTRRARWPARLRRRRPAARRPAWRARRCSTWCSRSPLTSASPLRGRTCDPYSARCCRRRASPPGATCCSCTRCTASCAWPVSSRRPRTQRSWASSQVRSSTRSVGWRATRTRRPTSPSTTGGSALTARPSEVTGATRAGRLGGTYAPPSAWWRETSLPSSLRPSASPRPPPRRASPCRRAPPRRASARAAQPPPRLRWRLRWPSARCHWSSTWRLCPRPPRR